MCTEDEAVCDPEYVPDGNVTLRGALVPNEFKATFENGYDTNSVVKMVRYTRNVDYPVFVREGYTFKDWTNYVETMPAQNVTFTATWTINNYTATFKNGYDESGDFDSSFEYSSNIISP